MINIDINQIPQYIGLTDEQYNKYVSQFLDLSNDDINNENKELQKISMMLHIQDSQIPDLESNAQKLDMPIELYQNFIEDFIAQSYDNKKKLSNVKSVAQNLLLDSFVTTIEQIEQSETKEEKKKLRKQYFNQIKELHV